MSEGRFEGRRVVVAITGGIAAFKSCWLVRELIRGGAEVQTLMSRAATEFVTPLTFATLSGRPVIFEMFPASAPSNPVHLESASWGELLVVAPATADFIGKLAHGLADDIPSTVGMAFRSPLLIAPAMNPKMWSSPAVRENIATLQSRGVFVIGPSEGAMGGAHEEPGVGRMSEPEDIADRIEELLADRTRWQGRRVVVTSGPTREAIDPVRFISNRSSGAMGDSVARQAVLRGAEVTLVRGRGAIGKPPAGVSLVEVDSAPEMAGEVKRLFPECDLLVMAAAVADWSPAKAAGRKLKKEAGAPVIEWRATEDILKWAGTARKRQAIVGFALETNDHLAGGLKKLESKRADLIVLNDPTRADSAFGGNTTRLTLLSRDCDPVELPLLTKRLAAERLLDELERFLPRGS